MELVLVRSFLVRGLRRRHGRRTPIRPWRRRRRRVLGHRPALGTERAGARPAGAWTPTSTANSCTRSCRRSSGGRTRRPDRRWVRPTRCCTCTPVCTRECPSPPWPPATRTTARTPSGCRASPWGRPPGYSTWGRCSAGSGRPWARRRWRQHGGCPMVNSSTAVRGASAG